MRDLRSPALLVTKGVLFLVAAFLAAATLLLEDATARRAFLIAVLAWSTARFYYFLFYVLAGDSANLEFTWTDDRGEIATHKVALEVA